MFDGIHIGTFLSWCVRELCPIIYSDDRCDMKCLMAFHITTFLVRELSDNILMIIVACYTTMKYHEISVTPRSDIP